MSGEDERIDDATDERRLFGEERETRAGFLACDLGVVRAALADDRVGHVGIVERCTAVSVAASAERVLAGTVRGVLADGGDGFDRLGEVFETAAVGLADDGRALAAGEDGHVLVWDGTHWGTVGEVASPQRFDGELLAAGGGVYRVADGLDALGLADAHDVAAGEEPLAATEDGIYRLGVDGWHREHDRPAATVVTGGGHAHAIDDRGVLARVDGDWTRLDVPELPVDLGYCDGPCGVTAGGTLLVRASASGGTDGTDADWRSHPFGLRGVVELAVQ